MAKNTLAGSKTGKSESAKYFQNNEEARKKKIAYQKKYNATEQAKNYRVRLNKENRADGTYGNKDGIDQSHTKSGRLVHEKQSANRARNGKGGKSTKK